MEHVIFFAYVLLFSSGFAGAVSLGYLFFRLRRPSLQFFIALQLSYLVGLGLQAAYFYFKNVASPKSLPGSASLQQALVVLSGAAGAALYWFSLLAFRAERWFRAERCRIAFLPSTAGISHIGAARLMSARLIAYAIGIRLRLPAPVSYLPATLAILFSGLLLMLLRFPDEPASFRFLVRGYGASLLAFVPLTFLEMALAQVASISLKPLSLDFLFFFMWNSVSIASAVKSLSPATAGATPSLLDRVPESLIVRFGLSPREREMILLIAKGLPNKGIAAELGISPYTVRTHIYNLFQKVGARSRIELFTLLKEAGEE